MDLKTQGLARTKSWDCQNESRAMSLQCETGRKPSSGCALSSHDTTFRSIDVPKHQCAFSRSIPSYRRT
ncbi:hypothetical protein GLOTRDRAFT_99778 [Gloeophyllum trabeum ATCC 11539]|uniref:Uncharacterized protein n=1 Tax=Gloeophyllum trabeum (strain ATCC 11539 / FP-39264 / Madison 617) TaxID=670483 RepID=S7QBP7_GLOTA|nr:uncharacterized protein GLOTRDRAFT_99778 [Gloeophyllum trabeum ATCC 11539]EPQ56777.1 hypothetical protein GLOTRDRAFT_99778 [Gloeophyllum trabeum ATCC 11539]